MSRRSVESSAPASAQRAAASSASQTRVIVHSVAGNGASPKIPSSYDDWLGVSPERATRRVRWDVTSRMPQLAPDGKTTKVTSFYDGDAAKQFEAIWHYIQSVKTTDK